MTRARVFAAACLAVSAGCSRTPGPAGVAASSPAASNTGVGSLASAPAAGSAQPALPSATLPDGCWSGFATDVPAGAPLERLKALAERCAQGMKALEREPVALDLVAGQTKRHEFEVGSPAGCIRLLAVGGAGVSDLELDLRDARDASRGKDQLRAPFALAPGAGAICLEPGKYRALVSVSSGAGPVALSAYAAE